MKSLLTLSILLLSYFSVKAQQIDYANSDILINAKSKQATQTHKRMQMSWQLPRGSEVWSNDHRYQLAMQDDGNLVLYKIANGVTRALWASGTNGKSIAKCIFQLDGNLVLYDYANNPQWASGTDQKGAGYMLLQNDGNLVIYKNNGTAIWATGTDEKY